MKIILLFLLLSTLLFSPNLIKEKEEIIENPNYIRNIKVEKSIEDTIFKPYIIIRKDNQFDDTLIVKSKYLYHCGSHWHLGGKEYNDTYWSDKRPILVKDTLYTKQSIDSILNFSDSMEQANKYYIDSVSHFRDSIKKQEDKAWEF